MLSIWRLVRNHYEFTHVDSDPTVFLWSTWCLPAMQSNYSFLQGRIGLSIFSHWKGRHPNCLGTYMPLEKEFANGYEFFTEFRIPIEFSQQSIPCWFLLRAYCIVGLWQLSVLNSYSGSDWSTFIFWFYYTLCICIRALCDPAGACASLKSSPFDVGPGASSTAPPKRDFCRVGDEQSPIDKQKCACR